MALGNRPVRCMAPSQSKADEVQGREPASLHSRSRFVPSEMLRLRATGVRNDAIVAWTAYCPGMAWTADELSIWPGLFTSFVKLLDSDGYRNLHLPRGFTDLHWRQH